MRSESFATLLNGRLGLTKRVHIRAHSSVRFAAANLDPLDVTLALRLPPDHQHRDGEPRLVWTRNGKVAENGTYRGGFWSLSTQQHVDSPRLQTHLEWLLLLLEPRANAIGELQEQGTSIDFFCYTLSTSAEPPTVPRSIRKRAAKLGIEIVIDHYVDDSGITSV